MHLPYFDDDKRETRAEISTLQIFSMPCNGAAERAKSKNRTKHFSCSL